jgi:hypothetical protein
MPISDSLMDAQIQVRVISLRKPEKVSAPVVTLTGEQEKNLMSTLPSLPVGWVPGSYFNNRKAALVRAVRG